MSTVREGVSGIDNGAVRGVKGVMDWGPVLAHPTMFEGSLILAAILVLWAFWVFVGPRLFRQRGREDWRRSVTFFGVLAFVLGAVAGVGFAMGETLWLVGRFAFLIVLWMVVARVAALVPERYWERALALALYLGTALLLLPELRELLDFLSGIQFHFGETSFSVAGVVKGVVILSFALYVGMGLARFIEDKLEGLSGLSPSLRVLLGKIARIVLIIVAVLAGFEVIGVDLTLLKFLGGGLGLGLGFGLQKVVSNLVCGFILLADRSIKPGDVIEVEDSYGWINNLRARHVSVLTRDGKEHLIPNEDLITQRVVNWSYSDEKVRLKIPVGVSYKSEVHQVRELLLRAAAEEKRILKDPAPNCLLLAFSDSSVDFELRIWVADAYNGITNVRSAVLFRIWDLFKEHGVEIPFPQRDVHLFRADAMKGVDGD